MRAPRIAAAQVQVGDLILTPYYPRTWLPVENVVKDNTPPFRPIHIDTARTRTSHEPDDLIPCKRVDRC